MPTELRNLVDVISSPASDRAQQRALELIAAAARAAGFDVDQSRPMRIHRGDEQVFVHMRQSSEGYPEARITGHHDYGGIKVRATKRIPFEDRISRVEEIISQEFREQAARAVRWAREAEEREKRRLVEVAAFQVQNVAQKRAEALERQVDRWERSERILAYVEKQRARIAGIAGEERDRAEEWLGWAQNYAETTAPAIAELELPAIEPVSDLYLPLRLQPPSRR